MNSQNLAVFIDYENVEKSKVDIKIVINELKEKGRLLIKKAYADWGRYRGAKQEMLENTIDTVELPSYKGRQKNSSDIKLTVDSLETALTIPYIDTIVIISSDSDYIPLISKLRELNKYVIVIGQKKNMSSLLKEYCDELIYLKSDRDDFGDINEAYALMVRAIKSLENQGISPTSSRVKQQIRRIDSSFDEKNYGFAQFKTFVKQANRNAIISYEEIGEGEFSIKLKNSSGFDISANSDITAIISKLLKREFEGTFLGKEIHQEILQCIYNLVSENPNTLTQSELGQKVIDSLPNRNLSKNKVSKVFKMVKKSDYIQFDTADEESPSFIHFTKELDSTKKLFDIHNKTIEDIISDNEISLTQDQKKVVLIE